MKWHWPDNSLLHNISHLRVAFSNIHTQNFNYTYRAAKQTTAQQLILNLKDGSALNGEICILDNGHLRITTPDQRSLTLTQWKIQPLSLEKLIAFKNGDYFEIRFTNICALEAPHLGVFDSIIVNTKIPNLLESYCLVKGGWLPPGYGLLNAHAFCDRNFIGRISNYFENNKAKSKEVESWIDDLTNFNLTFDVIPYAMEANKKRFPTKEEVIEQIEEARKKLNHAAPGVKITEYPESLENYAWRLLEGIRPNIQRRMEFLMKASQFIKSTTTDEIILERWRAITKIADTLSIRGDIVHLLALITVSEPQDSSLGKGVLKISHPYPSEKAYNACFDISQLELLLNIQKIDQSRQWVIITKDVPFTKLAGIILQGIEHNGSSENRLRLSMRTPADWIPGQNINLARELQNLLASQKTH
ncbi:hypothetical protein [Pseudomonas sp. KCJK8993]|uniref:hypothetical protein n=1 Tax=Pseudomonas sp. KCJK8993 TaxID=3344565 RepID=UPI003906666E